MERKICFKVSNDLLSEIEVSFLILSNDFDQAVKQLIHVVTANGFEAVNNGNKVISDIYYDTTKKDLMRAKSNLRIRSVEGVNSVVTFKRLKNDEENYSSRIEIENRWSFETYDKITNELKLLDLYFIDLSYHFNNDPKVTFKNLGLIVIHKKRTNRIIIDAINISTRIKEFELAFDHVTIDIDSMKSISFLELEIESKNIGNELELGKFVNDLKNDPNILRWKYNKLETGMSIAILYVNNMFERNKDYHENNILSIAGINKVESYIKNELYKKH